jgi:hypothetical protein
MNPTVADALAFSLEVGAVDVEYVHAEALRMDVSREHLADDTLDVLSCMHRSDAISALHALSANSMKEHASRIIIGVLQASLLSSRLSQRQVTKALERMAREGYLPTPEAEGAMYFFEEDLSLIEAGELDSNFHAKIIEELHAFMSQHAA